LPSADVCPRSASFQQPAPGLIEARHPEHDKRCVHKEDFHRRSACETISLRKSQEEIGRLQMEFNVFEFFKDYKRTSNGPMTPEAQGTSYFLGGPMGRAFAITPSLTPIKPV
jgi:hypothetical protein